MFDELINTDNIINIYVDNIKVSGVALDGTPIPDVCTETANLTYYTMLVDKGQEIIDIAAHSDNEIHEYKVTIGDIYTWIYDGKIIQYRLLDDGVLGANVIIKLCGKFKYIRGDEEINRVF